MNTVAYLLVTMMCLTGPGVSTVTSGENLNAVCQHFDLNQDHRVDLIDFAALQNQSDCLYFEWTFNPEGCP